MKNKYMHDNPNRTTPIGLSRYAREFFNCAMITDEKLGHQLNVAPIPVMYLIAHSIELCLKSYLLFKGVPLIDLKRKYGHDLIKCFKKAKELELDKIVNLNKIEQDAFVILNELYSTKQLNYIVTGVNFFPNFELILLVSKKLLDSICPLVGYK
ncbi:hypothetical protein DOJK_00433 [Patescibacteria group bacterium]|nr:hypothetical protein DOJK_00433 [Patescibacteria group bacterium]